MTQQAEQREFNVAVIGLGKMGVMHCAMCSAVPGVRIAALLDADPKLGGQVRSMGVDAPSFPTLDALIQSGVELDAAVIATPQFTHRELGVACLERGLHVFCEKPLAHTLADAQAMADATQQFPKQITAIGFMKGHYPLWLEAARRLHENWIGAPRRFRASVYLSQVLSPKKGWTFTKEKAGGGVLINTGIHLIHLLHVLFGKTKKISAMGRPLHSGVEDTLTAIIEYESGVFGNYDASWSVPGYPTEGTTVVIEGDAGIMEITDDWLRIYQLTGDGPAPKGWSQSHRSEFDRAEFTLSPDYGGEGYYNQIADFAAAIRENRPARYDWRTGLEIQKVIDEIYSSANL